MGEGSGGKLSEDGNEEEAFRGEGMTHLEKMEVRLESGDRNLSPRFLEDGLKGFASVGIGQKGWLGHKMTE